MTENNNCGTSGCGCSQGATANVASGEKIVASKAARKEIDIEFLYLDLEVCDQCKGSESNLDEALREISAVLEKTGVTVNVNKIHVESFEQAQKLQFISSPTIRVGGRDVAIEVKENYCSSCSELSGNETYCRVWNFQGEEFSTAPKSLVIEAILKEIYGAGIEAKETKPEQIAESLENLKRFFDGRNNQKAVGNESETPISIQPARPVQPAESAGCGCS